MSDWKGDLHTLFRQVEQTEQQRKEHQEHLEQARTQFFEFTILPAFRDFKHEVEQHKRAVELQEEDCQVSFLVIYEGTLELHFSVEVDASEYPYPTYSVLSPKQIEMRHERPLYFFGEGGEKKTVTTLSKEYVIDYLLREYSHILGHLLKEATEQQPDGNGDRRW